MVRVGPTRYILPHDRKLDTSVQAAMVEVLYKMGDSYREAAAKVVMDILQREEGHPGALFQYAAIANDRGLTEDAVRVLLRLLVLDPDNAKVK